MNENNNRVKEAIPQPVFDEVMHLLGQVEAKLAPFLIGLSPEERMGLPKINVDNRDYVNDAINQMDTPDALAILPAFLKPQDAKTDITVFGQMEKIGLRINGTYSKVEATRILAGSEAFTTSLMFKKLAEAGEAAGIPGAAAIAEALRQRFKGQGGNDSGDNNGSQPQG